MRQTLVEIVIFVFLAGVTLAHRLTMSNIHINWPSVVTARRIAPWLGKFELSAFGSSVRIQLSPDPQYDSQITFTSPKKLKGDATGKSLASAGVYVLKASKIITLVEDSDIRLNDGDAVVMVVPAPTRLSDLVELLPTKDFQAKTMDLFTMNKDVPRGVFTAQIMTEQAAYNNYRSYTVVGHITPGADSKH